MQWDKQFYIASALLKTNFSEADFGFVRQLFLVRPFFQIRGQILKVLGITLAFLRLYFDQLPVTPKTRVSKIVIRGVWPALTGLA